ncbi:hypothetical protein [Inediibacterium massiliense]|uniref:hypothetical protein n=1 Tax=Inediibacterium massiliense TaxID=1658111 RepID=UPI0006B5AAFC|nr:hypothetical protein [Inediibacterium massiliense]
MEGEERTKIEEKVEKKEKQKVEGVYIKENEFKKLNEDVKRISEEMKKLEELHERVQYIEEYLSRRRGLFGRRI